MTNGRILVVDDEAQGRELLVRLLEQFAFNAFGVETGKEALRWVEEGDVAVMLLDFAMPELDGVEVCRLVRTHPDPKVAGTPIIMLTGFAGDDQEVRCLRAGADDFVVKPLNASVLRARIETHLRIRQLRAQLEEQNGSLERWQAEIERDMEAARLTQQAILPQRQPNIPGWELETFYQPVIQVGGDIYDWITTREGLTYFWISDATGHGASAALMTALAKSLFRHAQEGNEDPAAILSSVNEAYLKVFRSRFLLTAMCVRLNPTSGELLVAGAGHPPVVILRSGESLEQIASCAPPLGIGELEPIESTRVNLSSGERVLLWTDGFFGMPREDGSRIELEEILTLAGNLTAEKNWPEALVQAIRTFWGSESPWPDDLTLVTFRRKP